MSNLTQNWRVKTKENTFKSKLNFLDVLKKNPFKKDKKNSFKNHFNNENSFNDSKNIFGKKKAKPDKPEIKSFNKKIIIHKKENKNVKYKDKFKSIKSSNVISKPKNDIKTEDKKIDKRDSWYHVYDYEIKRENELKKAIHKPDNYYYTYNINYNLHKNDNITKKNKDNSNYNINEVLTLMQYLLVDIDDVDYAYKYYKTTNLRFDEFICKYSLDHIIKMDKKKLFKLNRNISNKLKSINKIDIKINNNIKLNKNEILKYKLKDELVFKKKQIDFYKKYLENRK